MDLSILKNKCIDVAIEHGVASFEIIENSRKTNRLYDKKRSLFKKLKGLNGGIGVLYELTKHENVYVCYSASIYLLSVDEAYAKKVIKECSKFSRHIAFDVCYLLEEWDKGMLREYYS